MRSIATELALEYLRVLWGDSAFRTDWEQVKRGTLDFQMFVSRWKLPPTLVRAFLRELELPAEQRAFYEQAVPEPETHELLRLVEKIPTAVQSGTVRVESSGATLEPEPPPKPLESLPEPAPEGETQAEYLARARALIAQERAFASLLEQVEQIPDPNMRKQYLKALEGQEPRLLPEAETRLAGLFANARELEQLILRAARRHYNACAEHTTPIRARNRESSSEYIQRVALQVYLRVVRQWSWGQIAMRVKEKRETVRWSTERAIRLLQFPSETV